MGVYKTVNGAYRYSLMPTYYVKGCSPLALPLGELSPQVTERVLALPFGELSPQVTERVLQPFSNDNINLFTHITEISVYIPVGESQNLQPKRHQELRTFSIISKPLRFVMLRAIQFNYQSGRSAVKVHLVWSLVTLSVLAALGHLSQGERTGYHTKCNSGKKKRQHGHQGVKCSYHTNKNTEVDMLSYTHFTLDERKYLQQLLAEGKSFREIARILE